MTPDVSTNDYAALGTALRARRERRRMTRAQVAAAGGPSPATIQRIESGEIKTGLAPATKQDLEQALELEDGWIDRFLAGATREPEPAVLESHGERI